MSAFTAIIEKIEQNGGKVQPRGAGQASATCPAHEDHSPSLSITAIEGQALLFCHAGCSTADVVAALGLSMSDLFDDPRGVSYRYDSGRTVLRSPDKRFRQTNTEAPVELYRLAKVRQAALWGVPVYVVEGEKDVHAIEALGYTATCSPMGAGKWAKVDPSPLYGGTVIVVADQDEAGRRHAADVYRSLEGHASVKVVAPKVGKDAADHIAAGHGIADFVPQPAQSSVTVVRLSDVVAERVDWLWAGRLPLGKLVVLDGDPSVGKSTLAVDCAARVSTGRAWPDGADNRVGSVLLLSAEDGLADTIRPRLDAAGADPTRVHALTEVRYADEAGQQRTRPVTLADLTQIETAVKSSAASLVVIDVLMAFLPGKVDAHRDQDVRGVLSGLAAMAERQHCTVLLLRHLNKAAGGSAMYRGGGSIGIIGAARVGLLAAHDPDDPERRVLAGIKSNLAQMPEALAYRLVDSPEHGCAHVEWLGASEHTAGALLAGPRDDDERTERSAAADWLVGFLDTQGGSAPRKDVLRAAKGEGHSDRTLQRALSAAGVTTERVGFPSTTVWRLAVAPVTPVVPQHENRGATVATGATVDSQGVQASPVLQSRQSRHLSGVGTTDSEARDCGHPASVITTTGKCALCIAQQANTRTGMPFADALAATPDDEPEPIHACAGPGVCRTAGCRHAVAS